MAVAGDQRIPRWTDRHGPPGDGMEVANRRLEVDHRSAHMMEADHDRRTGWLNIGILISVVSVPLIE